VRLPSKQTVASSSLAEPAPVFRCDATPPEGRGEARTA